MLDTHAMSMLFPRSGIPAGLQIQEGKALLLVDFQNDFVSPEGKLPVANTRNFLKQIPILASKFRSEGTVIWCRTEYRQPRQRYIPELGTSSILLKADLEPDAAVADLEEGEEDGATSADQSALPPSRRDRPGSRQQQDSFHSAPSGQQDPEAFLAKQGKPDDGRTPCLPDTTGAQYPDIILEAVDTANDIDIVKSNYSAFTDTTLLLYIRMRLITHLYVCGSLSNVSVYATVLDAVRHGIQVTLIEDLLGYTNESCHIEAMRQMVDRMGALGVDFQELMDDLAGLLGDVISESDLASQFQVNISSGPRRRGHPSEAHEDRSQEKVRRRNKAKRDAPSGADDASRLYKSTKRSSGQGTAAAEMSPRRRESASNVQVMGSSLSPIKSAEGPQDHDPGGRIGSQKAPSSIAEGKSGKEIREKREKDTGRSRREKDSESKEKGHEKQKEKPR